MHDASRYKQDFDVLIQRLKAITLADETRDWAKAQVMELVPDDDVNVIVGTADLRRVAKEVELKHKVVAATSTNKGWPQQPKGGGSYQWVPSQSNNSQQQKGDGKGKDKGKGKDNKKGDKKGE